MTTRKGRVGREAESGFRMEVNVTDGRVILMYGRNHNTVIILQRKKERKDSPGPCFPASLKHFIFLCIPAISMRAPFLALGLGSSLSEMKP